MARNRRTKANGTQRVFEFRDKDGRRHRTGRPRSQDSGIPHTRREEFSPDHPLHVTLKICDGLPSMRKRCAFKAVMRSFAAGKLGVQGTGGFRLTQLSEIQLIGGSLAAAVGGTGQFATLDILLDPIPELSTGFGDFLAGYPGVLENSLSGGVVWSITMTPEPGTGLLLGFALVALGVHGRRRQRR